MDFNSLLLLASSQSQHQKSKSSYSTKISAAKKEEKQKKGVLSKGVQAFLDRQKKEKVDKALENRKRVEELRQTRKNLNTQKRANAMASRTKDNLKVFKKEDFETSDDPLPDDYDKPIELSMEKRRCSNQRGFLSAPSPKSVRVQPTSPGKFLPSPAALMARERADREPGESKETLSSSEEDNKESSKSSSKHKSSHSHSSDSKHKSSRKSSHSSESRHKSSHSSDSSKHKSSSSSKDSDKSSIDSKHKPKIKPRPRPAGPPPMSFEALMSMAQVKHKMPVELKIKKTEQKKPKNDRPMTQEEKEIEAMKQSAEYRAWYKKGGERPKVLKRDDEYSDDSEDDEPPPKVSRPSSDAPQDRKHSAMVGRSPGFGGQGERMGGSSSTKHPQKNISASRFNGGNAKDIERSKQQVLSQDDRRKIPDKSRLSSETSKPEKHQRTDSRANNHASSGSKPLKRQLSDDNEGRTVKSKVPPQVSKQNMGKSSNASRKSSSQVTASAAADRRISASSSRSKVEPREHILQCGPPKKTPAVSRDSKRDDIKKEKSTD